MPPLSSHQSSSTTKLLLIGDSGAGKTGALASLATAGYNLRILDLDNGIDILANYLNDPQSTYRKTSPDALSRVHYLTLTDKMKNLNGKLIPEKVSVWTRTMNALMEWKDGDTSLGKITDWTSQDILVIDSLSALAQAALFFHLQMNGALGGSRTQNEGRRDIGVAQNLIRDFLQLLASDSLKCNIILTAHITFVTEGGMKPDPEKSSEGTSYGYPAAVGRALSPHIPRYFNNVLIARAEGAGRQAKHYIYTSAQLVGGQIVNGKTSAPTKVLERYPLETGLADYFKAIRA
jgi:hypothetical protein